MKNDVLPIKTWNISCERVWETELPPLKQEERIILVKVKSNLCSFLRITVDLIGDDYESGYRFPILIEWVGIETIALHLCAFASFGSPEPKEAMHRIRFTAVDSAYEGTELEFLSIGWVTEAPLTQVNEQEWLLANFQSHYVWDVSEWTPSGEPSLPEDECGMSVEWGPAKIWYLEKENRSHRVAYEKKYDLDLTHYQAVLACLSTDSRTMCSIILQIDGILVPIMNKSIGRGTAEEFRVVINGGRLEKIIIELADIPEMRGENLHQVIGIDLRWIMLERIGADPAKSNEVRGIAPIPPIQLDQTDGKPAFPFGFVLDQNRLELLKQEVREGAAQKYFKQILEEAERNVNYRPEQFVGTYVPVDVFGRGLNRASAPGHELQRWISCLLNSSFAYAITGDIRFADSARRVLLAVLECDNWSPGLITRYPKGIPAYRHPMIDSHVVEAVALCYDIIYPLLTSEERERTEDAAFEKMVGWGDQILRQYGKGYLLKSNQGPIYFLGFLYAALLSRRRHPEVEKLIERHLPLFYKMLDHCCLPDGSTNEGVLYWVYGMQSVTTAMLVVSRCLGKELKEMVPDSIRNTMDFLLHLRSTSSRELNFIAISDGNHQEQHHFIGCPLLFYAQYLQDDRAYWLWDEWINKRDVPLYFGNKAGSYSTQAILTLAYLPKDMPIIDPNLPPFKQFPSCDRLFSRAKSEKGEMLLFFEGGPQTFEHTHYDKGQFVFEAYGESLALDPGMIDYKDPFSHELKRSVMHNVVTINGKNQSYKDPRQAVLLTRVSSDERICWIEADLSNTYETLIRYTRILIFLKSDYLLVIDDLEADVSGLEWNFHSQGQMQLDRLLVRVEAERAGMVMAFGSKEELTFKTTVSELKQYSYLIQKDEEYTSTFSSNLIVCPPEDAKKLQLATLLVPYPRGSFNGDHEAQIPVIKVLNDEKVIQFEVKGDFGHDRILCSFGTDRVVTMEREQEGGGWEVIM